MRHYSPPLLRRLLSGFGFALAGSVFFGIGNPAASLATTNIHYAATHLWQADVEHRSQSSPALARDGTIYVTTWSGKLLAFQPNGTLRWRAKLGMQSVATPAVTSADDIIVGARNKKVHAITAEGKLRWEFSTGAWVDASAAIGADDSVYVGSWDKKFYALSADGTKKWEFGTGGPIVSSAAIDADGVIYFGSHDRKFYALNPDGTKRWEFVTGGAITASPALGDEGEIYIPSTDGKLHALNPDGTRRWTLHTGGFTPASPVLGADGTIYLSVNQTHCAISSAGIFLWKRNLWNAQPRDFGETAAAVRADNTVVFTGGDGFAMTVPGANGEKEWLWNYWLSSRSYSAPLILPAGEVLVMSTAGKLSLLDQKVPPASTPWPMFRADAQRTGRVVSSSVVRTESK
jgi:outer membrane protein assembly factor BamB